MWKSQILSICLSTMLAGKIKVGSIEKKEKMTEIY